MVFSFPIPTTSRFSFQSCLSSTTHPSLPQAASTARSVLRLALKKHRKLSPVQRASHLPHILTALDDYIPFLFALSRGLSSEPSPSDEEDIDIVLLAEIEVEWRATLTSSSSPLPLLRGGGMGHDSLVRGRGLDFEIAFVLSTLGYVLSALGRISLLKTLYSSATPTPEQKSAAIQGAIKNLLLASSVHTFLASSPTFSGANIAAESTITASSVHHQESPPLHMVSDQSVAIPDIDPATQSALSTLAFAEATLLYTLKDDGYLSACIQSRNPHDREWMVKPPDIPKVRALLLARLCVRGAECADQAAASADGVGGKDGKGGKVDEDLLKYIRVLARVARAKACRFLGINTELEGKVGDGIAWLRAGRAALGFKVSLAGDDGIGATDVKGARKIAGGLSRLKREWKERREERKIEREVASLRTSEREADIDWGDDAGREEEGRVIDMLEEKWVKMNDTINTQIIPPSTSLLSSLPSGREILSPPAAYNPPHLDAEHLARMRAPPESTENPLDPDDSDEEVDTGKRPALMRPAETEGGYY